MTKLMKFLAKGVAFLALVTAITTLALPPLPSTAEDTFAAWPYGRMGSIEPVASGIGTISTNQVLLVRYVGTGSGKVAVAANGDLTFTDGTEGAEAANSDFECPVSGALGGVIDVSDAACDTFGEVVDTINGTCSTCAGTSTKWRAVILDGLRSESSNDTLVTISATAATARAGLALAGDNAVSFTNTVALTPYRDIQAYMENRNDYFIQNPYVGQRAALIIDTAKSTYGSGTSTLEVFSCAESLRTTSTFAGSETCTTLYSVAGGATTVAATMDFTPYGLLARKGEKLLVRVNNSAAMSAVTHYAYGLSWFYR